MIDQLGKLFSQKHDWQHRDHEQERMAPYFTGRRVMRTRRYSAGNHRFFVGARFGEEISVASSLDRQENPIQKNRKERKKRRLYGREASTRTRSLEVRQNERDHRKRNDDSKVSR